MGCLGVILLGFVCSIFAALGARYGTPETVSLIDGAGLLLVAVLFLAMVYVVYSIKKTDVDLVGFHAAGRRIVRRYQQQSNKLASEYDAESKPVRAEYEKKKSKIKSDDEALKQLRDQYQNLLEDIKDRYIPRAKTIENDCHEEETALCKEWISRIPSSLKWLKWVSRGICILAVTILAFLFIFGLNATDDDMPVYNSPTGGWTAKAIELPHLTDGERYVSNPDHVLTAETEAAINQTMRLMDKQLGIESAVIAVKRVANGDVFRFAQDVFDLYQIGKEDRGLVIVLATEDRKVRTHTGLSLEGDLTDIECKRLQEQYLVPYMKVNQPDEGMRALVEALYCHLSQKNMPIPKTPEANEGDDFDWMQIGILAGLVAWLLALWGFWDYTDNKWKDIKPKGLNRGPWYTDNLPRVYVYSPVYSSRSDSSHNSRSYSSNDSHSSSSSFWGSLLSSSDSDSSSRSSSSSRSGGYSGGRSGGGGATSSW